MSDRIRALRLARGWSQAELARRAGVTRALVGAVESERHLPNVSAALGLAQALDVTVERLFAVTAEEAHDVIGDDPRPGTPVRAARVGERLVSIPVPHGTVDAESWAVADGVWSGQGVHWLPGGTEAELVIAGCDPILGILSGLLARSGQRVLSVHASTGRALTSLSAGTVHGVLVHARRADLPRPPVHVRRWHVAGWAVGIGCSPALSAPLTIEELAERLPPVVQRDSGAGAQQALVRALHKVGGVTELPGPIGDGHLDVARRVAYGGGDAGVVMEAAALAFGLPFIALEEHVVELWLAEQWASSPVAVALLETLSSAALTERAGRLGGYDTTGCGVERTVS